MNKHPFQEHVSRIAVSRGLPKDSTPHDLYRHLDGTVTKRVAEPVRVTMDTAPQVDETKRVEVRLQINHNWMVDDAVKENGDDKFLLHLRRELVASMVRAVIEGGWADIRREGNEAVATITILKE